MQPSLLRLSFAALHFFRQLRKNRENITNYTEVRDREDRRILIFIDSDNMLGAFHAHGMLNRAADATGDVKGRLDRLAGLPDLVLVWVEAGVGGRAGRADRRAEGVGELLDDLEALLRPGAPPRGRDKG